MEIRIIEKNKKDYLDLLLLADEQEDRIDLYLESGTLFVLTDNGLKSVCVVIARLRFRFIKAAGLCFRTVSKITSPSIIVSRLWKTA